MQIYKYKHFTSAPYSYCFKLMSGYWAKVVLIWSSRKKKYLPDYSIVFTKNLPQRKSSTRATFIKQVGKTPEYIKGVLLRRLQRDTCYFVKELSKKKKCVEREIVGMERIQKLIKETLGA